MNDAVNSLLPIVMMVALGAALVGFGFMGGPFCTGLNRLVYWILLPAAIVARLAVSDLFAGSAGWLALTLMLVTLATLLLGYLAGWCLGLGYEQVGPLVQTCFRGNLMFVGLPVVLCAFPGSDSAATVAILAIAPLIMLYNVAAVLVLSAGREKPSWPLFRRMLRSVLTNPLIIACGVGALLALLPVRLPRVGVDCLSLLGKTAAPLALLSLGGALMTLPIRGRVWPALVGSVIKVAIAPLLTLGIARALGLDDQALRVGLILAASPAAAASYVLASQFQRDESLAAAGVVISTVLSMFTLAGVLLWTS